MNTKRKIALFIVLTSLARLIVAGSVELGNDEVYYQSYARFLQWNYFDHPPMVSWLIRLSTANLHLHHELFIRSGPVICAAIGTWFIFIIGTKVRNENAGWIAAVLYSTSFYSSIIVGVFILPDSPQVVFWLASIYFMLCVLDTRILRWQRNRCFILLGIMIGLCILSKVHGIFLWLGFGGYILFYRRQLLQNPYLWISGIITLVIISPIFFWNVSNHFITYTYHQGRLSFFGGSPDLDHLLQQVLGSVFYSNPVNFIIYILTANALARKKTDGFPIAFPLFLWLSLPLIVILIWTSLFSDTLPHWSGPAYLSWMVLAACWLDNLKKEHTITWLKTSGWVIGTVVVLAILSIWYLPVVLRGRRPGHLGKGDIMLDMSGWKKFAVDFDSVYQSDINSGRMKNNTFILSDYWFPAGHLEHYYAVPFHRELLAFGPLNNIHHFAWLNERSPRPQKGQDAYFIYPSNYYGPPGENLKEKFKRVEDSVLIPQYRAGNIVRYFVVYRMHGYQGDSLDFLVPGIKFNFR